MISSPACTYPVPMILNLPWPQSVNISMIAKRVSLSSSKTLHEGYRSRDVSAKQRPDHKHRADGHSVISVGVDHTVETGDAAFRVGDQRIVRRVPLSLRDILGPLAVGVSSESTLRPMIL